MDIFSAVAEYSENQIDFYIIFKEDFVNRDADRDATTNKLEDLIKDLYRLSEPWIEGYLWYSEMFELKEGNFEGVPCLQGSIQFGDSMDDEWLIVFCLREISKQYPDAYIKVFDNDGDFLLIEAANAIPKWLKPENADNRVWIYRGNLCIIPSTDVEKRRKPLSPMEALQTLDEKPELLYRPPLLQKEAFGRLDGYPEAAKVNIHRARVLLPRQLAQLLRAEPDLIAPITKEFLLRDAAVMKACESMDWFSPIDSVSCTIEFTRLIYSQLKSQRIVAPKIFHLPKPTEMGYAEAELGMKVACGFEIALARSAIKKFELKKKSSELPEFLQKHKDQIEEERSQLGIGPTFNKMTNHEKRLSERILDLIARLGDASDEEVASWNEEPDSDSWMDIDYDEFENLLQGGKKRSFNDSDEDNLEAAKKDIVESQERVQSLVGRIQSFLEDDNAGIDGAEFDDDLSSDGGYDTEGPRLEELSSEAEVQDADSDDEVKEEDVVNEDDFLEFFLQNALKLSPEEIEQYRAGSPEPTDQDLEAASKTSKREKKSSRKSDALRDELVSTGIIDEDADDDYEILKNLMDSIRSQEGGSGPSSNLLARLGLLNK
ncbi:SGT1 protein-domain-containing protein [Lipomyces arxii]|uniref:SGT1 protein-domain-containing protein n=1 Tax=Lipomyces arxii TaxID=56418 RepID=UPI0034CEF9C2